MATRPISRVLGGGYRINFHAAVPDLTVVAISAPDEYGHGRWLRTSQDSGPSSLFTASASFNRLISSAGAVCHPNPSFPRQSRWIAQSTSPNVSGCNETTLP